MDWLVKFAKSSIGAKFVMAVTGLALIGFVLAHMVGNLQIFAGRETLNAYAAFLKSKPALLWGARLGLLTVALLHVASGVRLALLNREARPVAYTSPANLKATWWSRTMVATGLVLLTFVLYHLAHFTWGLTHPDHFHGVDAQGRHDVYGMVVQGFQNIFVSGFYVLAMVLLGMHLAHGAASWLQTLGFNHPRYTPWLRKLAPVLAVIIVVGNISMPIAVLLGYIPLYP